MDLYLQPTLFFDHEHPDVGRWTDAQLAGVPDDPLAQARALYLAVRDQISYNPYVFDTRAETFRASHALREGQSYCIPKAVLLGAAARRVGIPSRLGLADVRNHLSSPRLIAWLQSDLFRMHGYIELHLNGRWVKATPAFNERLCRLMKVEPLAFDGVQDSVFQAFTPGGEVHMEYVCDHGTFADVPHDFIVSGIRSAYPHLFVEGAAGALERMASATLEGEVRSGLP